VLRHIFHPFEKYSKRHFKYNFEPWLLKQYEPSC